MKKTYIACLLALCVLILSGCSSVDNYIGSIKKGDYEKANSIFMEKIWGNSGDELDAEISLEEYISEVAQKLNNEKITVEECEEILNTLQRLSLWQQMDCSELTELCDSRKAYSAAEEAFQSGDYLGAMNLFSSVSQKDSKFSAASSEIAKCVDAYKEDIIARAKSAADEADYTFASTIIWDAVEVLDSIGVNCDDLRMLHSEYGNLMQNQAGQKRINEAKQYAAQGDYRQALNTLFLGMGSPQVQQAYNEMLAEFVNTALDKAQTKFEQDQNVDGAIRILEAAMSELDEVPDVLTSAYNYYAGYQTMALADLTEIYVENGVVADVSESSPSSYITDNYGNSYKAIVKIIPSFRNSTAEAAFNVSKYDSFFGTIYIPEIFRTGDGFYEVQIDIDGVPSFHSGAIEKDSEPIPFRLDVSSASKLTILVSEADISVMDELKVYFGNTYLSCDISGVPGFSERM